MSIDVISYCNSLLCRVTKHKSVRINFQFIGYIEKLFLVFKLLII